MRSLGSDLSSLLPNEAFKLTKRATTPPPGEDSTTRLAA
jgi:hypothetical protein